MAYQRRKSGGSKSWRIFKNEDIKAFTILVVDADGEQIGTMPRAKALQMASDQWMDLVQINYDPKTKICTAKIVDFGKYQYEKKKLESDQRKKQKSKVQKEIKFWYNIGDNDLKLKVAKAIEFLSKWNPVKINVVLRGREKAYKDIVRAKLDGVEEQLKEHGKTQWVKTENFGYTLVIVPARKWYTPPKKEAKKTPQEMKKIKRAELEKEKEREAKKKDKKAKAETSDKKEDKKDEE